MKLTERQTSNLLMLAEYLEQPILKAAFNMENYTGEPHSAKITDCGSVGCAVGHGPYAGVPKDTSENWNAYGWENFIPSDNYMTSFREGNEPVRYNWSFAFDSDWHRIDNTPQGAAKRIRYLLAGDEVPECFKKFIEYPSNTLYQEELKDWYAKNILNTES